MQVRRKFLPLVFQDKQEAFSPSQLPLFHTRTWATHPLSNWKNHHQQRTSLHQQREQLPEQQWKTFFISNHWPVPPWLVVVQQLPPSNSSRSCNSSSVTQLLLTPVVEAPPSSSVIFSVPWASSSRRRFALSAFSSFHASPLHWEQQWRIFFISSKSFVSFATAALWTASNRRFYKIKTAEASLLNHSSRS